MPNDRFNEYCEKYLASVSRSNAQDIARRVESLCNTLRRQGHVVQPMYGGSVMRGTDVTGLSDVDVLLIVNESSLSSQSPANAIAHVRAIIQRQFISNTVRAGNLAVTVEYSRGAEIQILPAIRTRRGGVRIAEPGSTRWSSVVRPEMFAEKLSEVNRARNGRVTPTIKLAKAIADCHIRREEAKISGYHMESLSIDAFRNYRGLLENRAMLEHLFGHSIEAVMRPIVDSTGQSRRVDDYLGNAGSRPRMRTSTYFGQMRGKVRRCTTRAQFNELFCIGN